MEINQLRWACRRGMLELDVLLERFLEQHYVHLTAEQKIYFENLLSMSDQDLFIWFMGRATPVDPTFRGLVAQIRAPLRDVVE